MGDVTRRGFCSAIACMTLGCTSVPRYLLRKENGWKVPFSAFDEQGKVLVIRPDHKPVLIIHQNAQYWGLSMKCTHRGCSLRPRKMDLVCPCHGSRFDLQGQVLEGPANRPLSQVQLTVHQEGLTLL